MSSARSDCQRRTQASKEVLRVGRRTFQYVPLRRTDCETSADHLPKSLKMILENLLRFEDGLTVTGDHVRAVMEWPSSRTADLEIPLRPNRILMQDFTAVPAFVDLAAMRDSMVRLGRDPELLNPEIPVDVVVDHSISVDFSGTSDALSRNVALEFARNEERFEFLRWSASAFTNVRIVPPGSGICHQINLERLAQVACVSGDDEDRVVCPEFILGTDSHTTMVNALGVLGWGVGGLEAEAAMLGQSSSVRLPEVVGLELTGQLGDRATATDLVLTITDLLRREGVVGSFVEFHGDGLDCLPLADRATIANMAPEAGATCCFFPVDDHTLDYLRMTGRRSEHVSLVEAYSKVQGLWRRPGDRPVFSRTVKLALSSVRPSVSGPRRPQDRCDLQEVQQAFDTNLHSFVGGTSTKAPSRSEGLTNGRPLTDGDVVIAAITSCTNTSNPGLMIAAGLVARKARQKGLLPRPWTKTSLSPGSRVVVDYLRKAGLQEDLDALGFNVTGFGCSTCCGNSGPLQTWVSEAIARDGVAAAAVLSGNRNYEGRISPDVSASFLASPPLVVAYAIAGTVRLNLDEDPVGTDEGGREVFLRDLWPTYEEIRRVVGEVVTKDIFSTRYGGEAEGGSWSSPEAPVSMTYPWRSDSTYVVRPPFFDDVDAVVSSISDITGARALAVLGDSITTDHISPAGSIGVDSSAGRLLLSRGVPASDFNSFGARRGNHEVMSRGTLSNRRLANQIAGGVVGGMTTHDGTVMPIYEAAMLHQAAGTPLVIVAGREYGAGSSRDWAAKGVHLLGVRVVLARSFERIHRSNLIGMGVLPLEFASTDDGSFSLSLDGSETFDVGGLDRLRPRCSVEVRVVRRDGSSETFQTTCCIDTESELKQFQHGGILKLVLGGRLKQTA